MTKRLTYIDQFKVVVALEALRGDKILEENAAIPLVVPEPGQQVETEHRRQDGRSVLRRLAEVKVRQTSMNSMPKWGDARDLDCGLGVPVHRISLDYDPNQRMSAQLDGRAWPIHRGRIGDMVGYDDRWCYHNHEAAHAALNAWEASGFEGEPEGWHRHPASGRRQEPII